MRIFIAFLLAGLLLQSASFAENGTITGKVIDKTTKKPLTGVLVKAILTNDKYKVEHFVFTDRYGIYKLNLVTGIYNVSFTYFLNIDTTFYNVKIGKSDKFKFDVEIDPDLSPKVKVTKDTLNSISDYSVSRDSKPKTTTLSDVERKPIPIDHSEVGEVSPLEPGHSSSIFDKIKHVFSSGSSSKGTSIETTVVKPESTTSFARVSEVSTETNIKAGMLTSGEVNDFRKWEMWNDIAADQLKKCRDEWQFYPKDRYTIQLVTLDNRPAIDCEVKLMTANGNVLWAGKTDNTGKAELWANFYGENQTDINNLSIEINRNGKIKKIENVKKFHDGINIVAIDEYCSLPKNVDIVFAVDATGSMGDEIKYLKTELDDVIGKLKDKSKDLNFNLGGVFYRDVGDDFLTEKSDLSNDIDKTLTFINSHNAAGGGDYPEAVDNALQTAINDISWSQSAITRILFLILDAPPHNNDLVKQKISELMAKAAMLGIRVIPVACSGIDKSTEYLMRTFALATNGTYVFLTNHSGIGDRHIEPTTDKYDVEFLNALFIRLIDQFTAVPACSGENPLAKADIKNNILNQDEKPIDSSTVNYENIINSIKCYPNPTNGTLNIEIIENIDEMYLVDITGKILEKFNNIGKGQQVIDLQPYPTGILFIKFAVAGKWGCQKVMLEH